MSRGLKETEAYEQQTKDMLVFPASHADPKRHIVQKLGTDECMHVWMISRVIRVDIG